METWREKRPSNLVVSKLNYNRPREEDRLFEFEGDPNHIVRVDDLDVINANLDQKLEPSVAVEKVRTIFDELKDKYHIKTPVDFKVESSEGRQLFYTITDKIDGINIDELDLNQENRPELIKVFEEFFLSLTKYFIDKFKINGLVLWDIAKSSAYVYGKKGDGAPSDLYLVDTDIKLSPGKSAMGDYCDILPFVKSFERKAGIKMFTLRKELETFINELNQFGTQKDSRWVTDIQEFLKDQ